MYSELHLVTYRQHERELAQRLERRRVAQERADAAPAAAAAPTGVSAFAAGVGAVAAAGAHAVGRLARARHDLRDASAPTACCSPA